MMKITALLALAATASAHLELHQLETVTFEDHVSTHALTFLQGSDEWKEREALFESELKRVKAHNAAGKSWKETINRFSHLNAKEKKEFFGRDKNIHHAHKLTGSIPQRLPNKNDKTVSELPNEIDWREHGIVSAVKDQGHCGSCWAFATTAVIESAVAKSSGLLFDLSVQQMAMCAPNPDHCGGTGNCEGSTAELGFDYIAKSTGMVEEYMYGYGAYYGNVTDCQVPSGPPKGTIGGYVTNPMNQLEPFMNSLVNEGPVAISVDASSWHAYASGVYDGCNQEQPDIDHAVVAVGYGEDDLGKYWIVRNSWSASWGEAGYIRLRREDSQDNVQCGTDTTPADGTACEADLSPQTVCGTCGILFDTAYPTNAKAVAA
jgi:cathepsin L